MAEKIRRHKEKTMPGWRLEWDEYSEDQNVDGRTVKTGWIPKGGIVLRNIYNEEFSMAREIGVAAVWVFPGKKAIEKGFKKPKKLILGPPDFLQTSDMYTELKTYEPVKLFQGKYTGKMYNFFMYNGSVIGDIQASWKSTEPVFGAESGHLHLTQRFVLTKYGNRPAHEPSGVLKAARLHPITTFYYDDLDDGYIESIRIDYRLHFKLDRAAVSYDVPYNPVDINRRIRNDNGFKSHVGVFKDREVTGLMPPAQVAVFAAAEKPLLYELATDVVINGLSAFKEGDQIRRTWDNFHLWAAGGNVHPSAPGAFHAIHMHWRWGIELQTRPSTKDPLGTTKTVLATPFRGYPQFEGESPFGILTDKRVRDQTIRIAAIKNYKIPDDPGEQTNEDFQAFFKSIRKDKLPIATNKNLGTEGGEDYIAYYSAEIFNNKKTIAMENGKRPLKGAVFIHGIYFAHENEPESPATGDLEEFYLNPERKKVKQEWDREPTSYYTY